MTHALRLPPPNLSIVDDDREFRALIRRIAEPIGWAVTEYSNGRTLISALDRSAPPDLILLDLVMPGLDGIEVISWIAATSVRCPIILITGTIPLHASVATGLAQEKGLEITEVFLKPVPVPKLREVLDAQFRLARP